MVLVTEAIVMSQDTFCDKKMKQCLPQSLNIDLSEGTYLSLYKINAFNSQSEHRSQPVHKHMLPLTLAPNGTFVHN